MCETHVEGNAEVVLVTRLKNIKEHRRPGRRRMSNIKIDLKKNVG